MLQKLPIAQLRENKDCSTFNRLGHKNHPYRREVRDQRRKDLSASRKPKAPPQGQAPTRQPPNTPQNQPQTQSSSSHQHAPPTQATKREKSVTIQDPVESQIEAPIGVLADSMFDNQEEPIDHSRRETSAISREELDAQIDQFMEGAPQASPDAHWNVGRGLWSEAKEDSDSSPHPDNTPMKPPWERGRAPSRERSARRGPKPQSLARSSTQTQNTQRGSSLRGRTPGRHQSPAPQMRLMADIHQKMWGKTNLGDTRPVGYQYLVTEEPQFGEQSKPPPSSLI